MNDNIEIEGPNHAAALALLNDLMIILANMHAQGIDRVEDGEGIYQPGFWSNECAKMVGVRPAKIA
jgi:hypothetical protein